MKNKESIEDSLITTNIDKDNQINLAQINENEAEENETKENEQLVGAAEIERMELIHELLENTKRNSSGFILSFITRHSKEMSIEAFELMVSQIVQEETNRIVTNLNIYDTVTLFKHISIGLDSPIYFYNNKRQICTLKDTLFIACLKTSN